MHARSGNGHSGNKEVKDQDKIKEPASATIEVDSPASEVLPEVLRQAYKDATSSLVQDDSALSEVVHEALSGGLETPKDAASSLNKVGPLANFTSEDLPESFKVTKSFSAEDGATTSAATPDALLEGLAKVMAGMTLRDEPADKEVDRATQLVQAYCFQHEPQFQRAMVYRDRVSRRSQSVFGVPKLMSNRDGITTKTREMLTSRVSVSKLIKRMIMVKRYSMP
jgi:hypothetical protein